VEPTCQGALRHCTARDLLCDLFQLLFRGQALIRHSVDGQEQHGRERGHALVAVDEGMVLAQVIEEGCRHRGQSTMQVLSIEHGLWHRDGRLQKAEVPDPGHATVIHDTVIVNAQGVVQAQEPQFPSHFARFSSICL